GSDGDGERYVLALAGHVYRLTAEPKWRQFHAPFVSRILEADRIRSSLGRFFMRTSLLLLLFVLLLMVGCRSSAEDAGAAGESLQIAVIPKGTTHEFWKSIHAGAEKAGQELGVDIVWQGPQKEDDRQMQIQVVQNFVSRGIDAIVLAPLDSRSLARPVEAAVRRGIPVVIIDSGLESDAHASFIATNNYEGGRMGGRHLAELLGGEGRIIMLRFQEGSASTTERERGFSDALREHAPNATLLVDNIYAGATMGSALQVSQNLLNRFAEVDGIGCPNEASTQGMLRALETAGRAGNVRLVGFDINQSLLDGMREGKIDGLVVQDPFTMGFEGVQTAVRIIKGEDFDEKVDTRSVLVTPDNVDDPDIQDLIHPDLERWLHGV